MEMAVLMVKKKSNYVVRTSGVSGNENLTVTEEEEKSGLLFQKLCIDSQTVGYIGIISGKDCKKSVSSIFSIKKLRFSLRTYLIQKFSGDGSRFTDPT